MSLAKSTAMLEFEDPTVQESLLKGLAVVEERLANVVDNGDAFLAEAATHLSKAGGKRFRPLLAFLAAQFGDPDVPEVAQVALVMELTHLATLYHDDVMDEAAIRRGAPSANARWSNSIAILAGDYLFAVASELVADLGSDTVKEQARTFARLVHGQIAETVGPPEGTDPIKWYLHVLAEKTGSLIATTVKLGAKLSGASDDVVTALEEYGEIIGVAFQLSDDLIDIASANETSGKTQGTDLLEGVPTLPVLYALSRDDTPSELRELLSKPVAEADLDKALTLLRSSEAMNSARAVLYEYGERAKAIVEQLPECPARDAFNSVCDYLVGRVS